MRNKTTVVTVVAVCCAWGAALAASHTVTNGWESMTSTGYADGTDDLSSANHWDNGANAATVVNGVVVVNASNATDKLTYCPAAPVGVWGMQTVEIRVEKVTPATLDDDVLGEGTQAAIATVANGAATNWYGFCATGWTKLTGPVPTNGGGCDVRMEFDNRTADKNIRYSVKAGDVWTVLTAEDAADGWLGNKQTSPERVHNIDFAGNGAFNKIELTQTGTVTVNDKRIEDAGITAAELGETGANGNPNWENVVLGLSCKDAASKPVVQPVQSGDPTTVTLALGGVNVDTASGATVKYTVTASDEIGGAGTTTQPVAYNETTPVALPNTGAKYYRMNVTTTPQ